MNKLVKLSEHCWVDPQKVDAIWVWFNDRYNLEPGYKIFARVGDGDIEVWRSKVSEDLYGKCLEMMKEIVTILNAHEPN